MHCYIYVTFFALGSRDGSISLWCVQDPVTQKEDNELNLCIKSPASQLYSTLDQQNKGKDKIRDLVYERNSQVIKMHFVSLFTF